MSKALLALIFSSLAVSTISDTYYVSPYGSDGSDGQSMGSAWRTLAKVNSTSFNPGDEIRFERGGEWRESLVPKTSGTPGMPILFADYGNGPPPRFFGSEVLANGSFDWLSDTTYRISLPAKVTSVLVDQGFLLGGTPVLSIDTVEQVKAVAGSWLWDSGMLFVNTGGPDPRVDHRVYSAVTRDNIVFAFNCSNLVFRNLDVDEAARYNAGYGFRIEQCSNVLVEDCSAYRCGKHHFGVINSTGFTGRRLYGAYAMPGQGNGGASTYVPYSDYRYHDTSSEWLDCMAEEMQDTYSGKSYPAFVTHGEGIASVLVSNMTATGSGVSIGAPDMVFAGGRIHNGTLCVYGNQAVVSGLHISGEDGAISVVGNENIIENCLIEGGNPQSGYKSMVTCNGTGNIIRFCTIVMSGNALDSSSCLALTSADSHTVWYGNIMWAKKRTFRLWNKSLSTLDVEQANYNFYNVNAEFTDATSSRTFSQWAALGYDNSSLTGDPDFAGFEDADFHLSEASFCIDAVPAGSCPASDYDHFPRPLDGDANGALGHDIGAFEFVHPNADSDGDGMKDADEIIAGTDALDACSKLAILDCCMTESGMRLRWIGGCSAIQVVECSTNLLQSDAWYPIHTNPPPTATTNSLRHVTSASSCYYRLRTGDP